MKRSLIILVMALAWGGSTAHTQAGLTPPPLKKLRFETPSGESVHLRGNSARLQVLLTGEQEDGRLIDLTRTTRYEVSPPGVVEISRSGRVTTLGNGSATISAQANNQVQANLVVSVSDFEAPQPVNFANQIVPIFTKGGCNGGGCHGKSGGQNGFRLSLLGFEPKEDWEHLVQEARGRRLFPAAPEQSLLLQKGTATLPHGGGKRLELASDDYRLLVRWINQGMPYGKAEDPRVERIEVIPKERTMPLQGEQQLMVAAHYTDGTWEDVTRSALYEANDKDMAHTEDNGLVSTADQPGDVAVMVRYQGQVTVFRATVPLGAPIDQLPTPNNFVDERVFAHLRTLGMPPSDICDDATFLRRVSLDIAGRLPSLDESKAFYADQNPDKRARRIDQLLDSSDYADYFANKWSALLRNKRSRPTYQHGTYSFYNWIRDSLRANKPFDQFVREILAASGDSVNQPPVLWYREVRDETSQLEDTAQLFLGQRLKCAQCHHHPFEKWSQQDYYSFGAFFSRVGRKATDRPGEEVIFHKRGKASSTNKKTGQGVSPAGLGAQPLDLDPDEDPRLALADWMTESSNPFFARSLVNRYWKHFFGRGLVDPEDDMRETNPATNPELLEALARHFVDHQYDLKELVRVICRSRTYQLSSLPNQYNKVDKKNFARFYPRRLTAEVLFDAVNQMTLTQAKFDNLPAGTRAVQLPDNSFNTQSYFLTVFGRPDMSSSCECERSQDASLAQCLHLLNAKDIQSKLTDNSGRAAQLAGEAQRADNDKITELYYLAYSRPPSTEELQTATNYLMGRVQKAEKPEEQQKARREVYEDMLWALINTKEFLFTH